MGRKKGGKNAPGHSAGGARKGAGRPRKDGSKAQARDASEAYDSVFHGHDDDSASVEDSPKMVPMAEIHPAFLPFLKVPHHIPLRVSMKHVGQAPLQPQRTPEQDAVSDGFDSESPSEGREQSTHDHIDEPPMEYYDNNIRNEDGNNSNHNHTSFTNGGPVAGPSTVHATANPYARASTSHVAQHPQPSSSPVILRDEPNGIQPIDSASASHQQEGPVARNGYHHSPAVRSTPILTPHHVTEDLPDTNDIQGTPYSQSHSLSVEPQHYPSPITPRVPMPPMASPANAQGSLPTPPLMGEPSLLRGQYRTSNSQAAPPPVNGMQTQPGSVSFYSMPNNRSQPSMHLQQQHSTPQLPLHTQLQPHVQANHQQSSHHLIPQSSSRPLQATAPQTPFPSPSQREYTSHSIAQSPYSNSRQNIPRPAPPMASLQPPTPVSQRDGFNNMTQLLNPSTRNIPPPVQRPQWASLGVSFNPNQGYAPSLLHTPHPLPHNSQPPTPSQGMHRGPGPPGGVNPSPTAAPHGTQNFGQRSFPQQLVSSSSISHNPHSLQIMAQQNQTPPQPSPHSNPQPHLQPPPQYASHHYPSNILPSDQLVSSGVANASYQQHYTSSQLPSSQSQQTLVSQHPSQSQPPQQREPILRSAQFLPPQHPSQPSHHSPVMERPSPLPPPPPQLAPPLAPPSHRPPFPNSHPSSFPPINNLSNTSPKQSRQPYRSLPHVDQLQVSPPPSGVSVNLPTSRLSPPPKPPQSAATMKLSGPTLISPRSPPPLPLERAQRRVPHVSPPASSSTTPTIGEMVVEDVQDPENFSKGGRQRRRCAVCIQKNNHQRAYDCPGRGDRTRCVSVGGGKLAPPRPYDIEPMDTLRAPRQDRQGRSNGEDVDMPHSPPELTVGGGEKTFKASDAINGAGSSIGMRMSSNNRMDALPAPIGGESRVVILASGQSNKRKRRCAVCIKLGKDGLECPGRGNRALCTSQPIQPLASKVRRT